ncbi:MAG: 3-dehydroquinate synthase [Cyclobacteriaceae bacterium]|nr:MAG: 3-dehydroquinate synthase [Cyclobacteriaceae bacterium]
MYELPAGVEITNDIVNVIGSYLDDNSYSKIGVLVDTNTSVHCYPLIESALPDHFVINIAAGEKHKDLNTCQGIWEEMTYHQMDRKSLLINLGGGVIGDMGGFCAGTFKRGIKFLNIPTTLLAQVDASIGGKLGVDFQGFKNHIGLFQEPERVLISPGFLLTLPSAELRSGFAEVIKHALISDAEYWNKILNIPWEMQPWDEHIAHSVYTKHRIVSEDPTERSIRKVLNFGHTIGHAIERHYLHEPKPLLHGEAIAVGMISECYLSSLKSNLPNNSVNEISEFITQVFGKIDIPEDELHTIAKNTIQDKKNEDGKIMCTLISGIGKATYDTPVTLSEVEQALQYYRGI